MTDAGVVEERPAGHEDLPVGEQGRGLVFASGGHAAGAGPGVGVRVVEHGARGGLRVRDQADEPAGDQECRSFSTATLLPTGNVLVAGGLVGLISNPQTTPGAMLYHPDTNTWTSTGTMTTGREEQVRIGAARQRSRHTSTLAGAPARPHRSAG